MLCCLFEEMQSDSPAVHYFMGIFFSPFPSHHLCYCFPIFHPQQPPSSQPSLWKWEVTLILTPVANGTNTVDALLFLSHDVEYPKLDICPTLEVDVNPSLGCDGYLNLNSNQNEPLSDAEHSCEVHLRLLCPTLKSSDLLIALMPGASWTFVLVEV